MSASSDVLSYQKILFSSEIFLLVMFDHFLYVAFSEISSFENINDELNFGKKTNILF